MRVFDTLARLMFPPCCISCKTLLPYDGAGGEVVFCSVCRARWERAKLESCPSCGKAAVDCRCLPSLLKDAGCSSLFRLASYEREGGVVFSAINSLKHTPDKDAFDFIALQMAELVKKSLAEDGVDMRDVTVICCPRRSSAKRREGFDQAEQLAKRIADFAGAEYEALLRRRAFVFAKEQKNLGAAERHINAKESVKVLHTADCIKGRVVLLVDDVVTTGATVAACAEALKNAGAMRIYAACIAAVPSPSKENMNEQV